MVSKNFVFKFMITLVIVISAVLWMLSVIFPTDFAEFSLAWAVVILSGGIGILFVLYGLFKKDITVLKKTYIWIGAGLLVIALFALASAIIIPNSYIVPIIALIGAVALLLGVIATGGKKWDHGDNQDLGYKNYHQRKAEQEKIEKENLDKNK